VVSDGVSGKLIPPGEITAIADAVIELLQNPQLRARMGQAGRPLVQRRLDMYEWARRLADTYAEATTNQNANKLGTS
jgi:glycosyltransferase involved in cell wall biosynthesis